MKLCFEITFARKNKKKSSIYFVILSLIRNIELRSNLLSLGKTKKNLRFILLFSRLLDKFLTLNKKNILFLFSLNRNFRNFALQSV